MTWSLPPSDTYFASILARTPAGFELDHLDLALKHCKRFRLAVDGGAHIGTWSVALSHRFAKVMAFEPADDTYACLRANTCAFQNITTAHVALGPYMGTCGVVDDPSRIGNTGARMVDLNASTTPMNPLDWYYLQDLDFLKLDLEGFESQALAGAMTNINRNHPTILIECKKFTPPRHGGPEAAINILKALGYRDVDGIGNDRVFVHGL
jgi:FkbM family methyltransferase